MKIADQLIARFTTLMNESVGPDQPNTIVCDTPQGTFRCELVGLDAFACQVQYIQFHCPGTEDCDPDELTKLSESLAEGLHYLLEPVSPVEFDRDAAVSQLRSNPPSEDETHGRAYYELLARPGSLEMRRYQKQPNARRQQILMTFTREVFGRLASDMVAAMSEMG